MSGFLGAINRYVGKDAVLPEVVPNKRYSSPPYLFVSARLGLAKANGLQCASVLPNTCLTIYRVLLGIALVTSADGDNFDIQEEGCQTITTVPVE